MKNYLYSCLFAFLFFFSCEEQDSVNGNGILKGKITIGPLCPVDTNPPLPQCLPTAETYKAWQTAVYTFEHSKVADLTPDLKGNYTLELGAGSYIIDFTEPKSSTVGSDNLPALIHLTKQDTLVFNINIDTGIR